MAIVSISEASRLTGKSRSTIHRHISTGKLSKTKDSTGTDGVDISELSRVYGLKKSNKRDSIDTVATKQIDTDDIVVMKTRLAVLENENSLLKNNNEELKDHVSSLKQAMNLLEYKKEESKPRRKGFFSRLFN